MRALYYNCNSGISGDMNVAAMLDLGLPLEYLKGELAKLNIPAYELNVSQKLKNGISGTQLKVICEGDSFWGIDSSLRETQCCNEDSHAHAHSHSHSHSHAHSHAHTHAHAHTHSHSEVHHSHKHHAHRNYADIKALILASTISERAKEISLAIFEKIAIAEAKVHSKSIDEVAFHEIGAVDSIVDIVASAIALDYFKVAKVYSSPVELGGGQVCCAHGVLSVPAPATTILMEGLPSSLNGDNFECTTPTGAGIISATVDSFEAKISGKIISSGIGIGHKDSKKLTNILRVSLIDVAIEPLSGVQLEDVVELSANIDDMTPENLAFLLERLLEFGALDAWQEAIYMKKSRLAQKVSMLCKLADEARLVDIFMKNSSTYGIRRELKSRYVLPRKLVEQDSPFGKLRLKESLNATYPRAKVDFDDKRRVALEQNIPIVGIAKDLEGF